MEMLERRSKHKKKKREKISTNNNRETEATQSVSGADFIQHGRHNNRFAFHLKCIRSLFVVMVNVKRFPGVLYRYKLHVGLALSFAISVYLLVHKWRLMCANNEIKREIESLCKSHEAGQAMGSLCIPLCVKNEIHSTSCISQHSKKQSVFTAKWNSRLIVMKSSRSKGRFSVVNSKSLKLFVRASLRKSSRDDAETLEKNNKEEEEFENAVRWHVSEKLNLTLTSAQLEDLKYLEAKIRLKGKERRKRERENVLTLLESQEYLLLKLFSDRGIFPQIVGTCGHFYGVEYLERPAFNSLFTLDDKAEWSERMKLAVAIMDFVEEVETNFPDALYLCDVQMSHLGVAPTGRIKFLDLDLVYMKNVIDKMLRSGRRCTEHKDCDFFDCKSTCNMKENVCDAGVVSDNLQTICEKIFIGWTMSGKMLIPGLLMSEFTPASLSALLRLCAENVREPVQEDLRQRLYTTLTEMHQILLQKLLDE